MMTNGSRAASRRLLLVSHRPLDYGGGGSVRWTYLRGELPRHGWEVHEVSARANPTANEVSVDPRAARLAAARARVMGVAGRVLRPAYALAGVTPEAFPPNVLWGLTGRGAVREAIARVRPHVVWATNPPHSALLAATAALRDAASPPLVVEMRDLWGGNPYFDRGGTLLARVEAPAFARADAVVSVTDGCREALLALHPEVAGKFELLPNGFDPVLLSQRAPAPGAHDGPWRLIHAGTLYADRSAAALVRALRRPEVAGRARLELVGVVDPETQRAAASADGLVDVRAPMRWDAAVERVRAADAAVVINSPGTGGAMALPSKLYEALALGKPVLALTPRGSDTERLLERLGQGAGCAPPDDEAAIAAAVRRLLDDPPPPVPPEALRPWDRSHVAERVAALCDRLATGS